MNTQTLVASLFLVPSLFGASEALAKPDLTPEQLAKAKETASQMKPPVDFEAMLNEADRLGVECTGDLTRGARIVICGQKVENAKIQENIDRLKADTEATKARREAIKAETETIKAETKKIHEENAELIREVQQRIKDNK